MPWGADGDWSVESRNLPPSCEFKVLGADANLGVASRDVVARPPRTLPAVHSCDFPGLPRPCPSRLIGPVSHYHRCPAAQAESLRGAVLGARDLEHPK